METEYTKHTKAELEMIIDWLLERDRDCYERMNIHKPREFDKIQAERMHIDKLHGIACQQRQQIIAAQVENGVSE